MNPEIQTKLRKNIKQTLDANDGKLAYDTLKDMKYLDMVINGQYYVIMECHDYDFKKIK